MARVGEGGRTAAQTLQKLPIAGGPAMMRLGRTGQTESFLRDAFEQLDMVLEANQHAELKASRQVIQRWLVILAREHLRVICEKLMAAAEAHSDGSQGSAGQSLERRHAY